MPERKLRYIRATAAEHACQDPARLLQPCTGRKTMTNALRHWCAFFPEPKKRADVGPCRPARAPSYAIAVNARTHVQAELCVCVYTVTMNVLFRQERRL